MTSFWTVSRVWEVDANVTNIDLPPHLNGLVYIQLCQYNVQYLTTIDIKDIMHVKQ